MKHSILAACLLVAFSCGRETNRSDSDTAAAKPATQQKTVRTAAVTISQFQPTIDTTGSVAFNQNQSTPVLSPISGPVVRILTDVGTRVNRGDALAIVASPDFAASVSALRKAEAVARNTRRIADLDQQLFKNDAIARRDLEQAQTDAINAEADRDAAIQQLRALGVSDASIAGIRDNKPVADPGGVIRSPIAGTVVEKLISPGQLLGPSTPCFTVADLSSVWVMANVFEGDLRAVHAGDSADVLTGSGQIATGRVDYIAALVDPNTRAVSVRIVAPNPGGVLKRDLYVRIAIHSRVPASGILVPISAILRDDDNLPFVFVTKPNGAFQRQRIDLGSRVGDRQEVRSGLTPGQTIVVDGGLFLQNEEQG